MLIGQVFFLHFALTCIATGIVTSTPIYPRQGAGEDISHTTQSCNRTFVSPLNDAQRGQIQSAMDDRLFIQSLKKGQEGEDVMMSPEMQKPIVTFMPKQKTEILQNYGNLFSKKPDFKSQEGRTQRSLSSVKSGTKVQSPHELKDWKTGNVLGLRICPPNQEYEALVLGFDENNNLVQIVQFPEEDAQQWFLEETCKEDVSPLTTAKCGLSTDRLVNAYIVDLQSSGEIKLGKIRVHSCVGFV